MTNFENSLPLDVVEQIKQMAAANTLDYYLTDCYIPTETTALDFLNQNPDEFNFSELSYCEDKEYCSYLTSYEAKSELLDYYQGHYDYLLKAALIGFHHGNH